MAARKGGLGKGLDSLIPETIKATPAEKTKIIEKEDAKYGINNHNEVR